MKDLSMKELTTIALLGVLILISGSFKIPSPIAGGEFQLSAPIAVLICACFGFKRYIIAGILASMLGMMLGMHSTCTDGIPSCCRWHHGPARN